MPPGRNIERPPSGKFTALPPDLNVEELIQTTPNFEEVQRLDARMVTPQNMKTVEEHIHRQVIVNGLPLVIHNWHLRSDWPSWIFNKEWLQENHGQARVLVRDIPNQDNIPMTFAHYLNNLAKLSSKFNSHSYETGKQRLYGKDLDCPPVWRDTLAGLLPKSTTYLEPAADLMSFLPEHARAENMMCYIGHEGTYTPAHKEMCASLGHNIMVAASSYDNHLTFRKGSEGTEGSSIWFMMSRDDRDVIAEYWLAQLGHDIEVENYFASLGDLAHAPFKVFIVEQKVGDYILVPPLAPHQVWNRGEYTIKAAWNRTTVDTLELAIQESLPKARLVCRDEQYKNRAIIYETLVRYLDILRHGKNSPSYIKDMSKATIASNFIRLFNLFNTILLDQSFADKAKDLDSKKVKKIDNEYNVSCSYCRANIWNRFLTCEHCVTKNEEGEDEIYDVCIDCYARGRSCSCVSKLSWVEQEDWSDLLQKHEEFRQMVIEIQGSITVDSPQKFYDALKALDRKTVGQVCDEQNRIRPFVDITMDPALESEDDAKTIEHKKKTGEILNCHVCKVRHPRWKSAVCTSPGCTKSYCYGNLWRAFDMDPCDVLVKRDWKCPVCLGICSCGACQRNPKMNPYKPQGTFLGAATRDFTDPRGTEVLVDFSKGNLNWIKPGDYEAMAKFKRKREEEDGEDEVMEGNTPTQTSYPWGYASGANDNDMDDGQPAHIPIDPALSGHTPDGDSQDGRHESGERPLNGRHKERNSTQMDDPTANDHDNPPLAKERNGGGQYLLSSSTHPSNMPPPHTSGDRHIASSPLHSDRYDSNSSYQQLPQLHQHQTTDQDIGMARNKQQYGEDGKAYAATDSRGVRDGGDTSHQHRVTLPSPSAMLTGAPPRRISPETTSQHGSANSPYLNKHPYSSNVSSDKHPNNPYSNNDTDSHLSILERNPNAFIAAAGLMQISHTSPSSEGVPISSSAMPTVTPTLTQSFSHNFIPHRSLNEGSASGGALHLGGEGNEGDIGVDSGSVEDVNSRSNSYPSVYTMDSHFASFNSNTTPVLPSPMKYTHTVVNPNPPPVPVPLPPELIAPPSPTKKGKRKSGFGASNPLGASPAVETPYDGTKFAWVRHQTKLANDRERGKRYRTKSKIVKLKISSERLSELENLWKEKAASNNSVLGAVGPSAAPDDDLVTTDLTVTSSTKKSRRGLLKSTFTLEDSPYHKAAIEVAEPAFVGSDDDESDPNEEELEVMPKRKDRRESAWIARKRQEWGEEIVSPELLGSPSTPGSEKGTGKRKNRGVSRNELQSIVKSAKALLDDGNRSERGYEHEDGMQDGAFVQDDVSFSQDFQAVTRSESEVRRLAEEEEEKRKQEELEAARKKAEEERLARLREEQRKKEEARQRELELERKRKEEIRRAYAESKQFALKVATGEASPGDWNDDDSESSSAGEDGGYNDGPEDEWEDNWDSEEKKRELIPPGDDFAVVIVNSQSWQWDPNQYEQCVILDDGSTLEHEEPPNMDANTSLQASANRKGGRGKPAKRKASTSLSKTPKERGGKRSRSETAATPTPAPPKSHKRHSAANTDTTFRSSYRRPRRSEAESEGDEDVEAEDAEEISPRSRKRARPSTKINTKHKPSSSSAAAASSSPITPIRSSTRQRKVLYSTLNYDDDNDDAIAAAEEEDEGSVKDEPQEEIDPDVGLLERERQRLERRREKRRRGGVALGSRDTSVALKGDLELEGGLRASAAAEGLQGEGVEAGTEDFPVVIEEAYNSRWRR